MSNPQYIAVMENNIAEPASKIDGKIKVVLKQLEVPRDVEVSQVAGTHMFDAVSFVVRFTYLDKKHGITFVLHHKIIDEAHDDPTYKKLKALVDSITDYFCVTFKNTLNPHVMVLSHFKKRVHDGLMQMIPEFIQKEFHELEKYEKYGKYYDYGLLTKSPIPAPMFHWESNTPVPAFKPSGIMSIAKRLPGATTKVKAPCKCYGVIQETLMEIVIHLNDADKWSREKIADWIDELHEAGIINAEFEVETISDEEIKELSEGGEK